MRYSGTRVSGLRSAAPAAVTTSTATIPPAAATGRLWALDPTPKTMKATSRPSSRTPLKEMMKPIQSVAPSRPATVFWNASPSSCWAITLADPRKAAPKTRTLVTIPLDPSRDSWNTAIVSDVPEPEPAQPGAALAALTARLLAAHQVPKVGLVRQRFEAPVERHPEAAAERET